MPELTGILSGTGAKMKAEVGADTVSFRGAVKADVPFEEIVAEARGTLLVLTFRGHTVELGGGSRAAQLAARIRSPPSRMQRLGVEAGATAAIAGPLDGGLRSELAAHANLLSGMPRQPLDVLFLAAGEAAQLQALGKLRPLLGPRGVLWVVATDGALAEPAVRAAAKSAGLALAGKVPLPPGHAAFRLTLS